MNSVFFCKSRFEFMPWFSFLFQFHLTNLNVTEEEYLIFTCEFFLVLYKMHMTFYVYCVLLCTHLLMTDDVDSKLHYSAICLIDLYLCLVFHALCYSSITWECTFLQIFAGVCCHLECRRVVGYVPKISLCPSSPASTWKGLSYNT